MQVKSIAECSKGSILQYFRPSLSYIETFFVKTIVLSILSGRFRQGLLHTIPAANTNRVDQNMDAQANLRYRRSHITQITGGGGMTQLKLDIRVYV